MNTFLITIDGPSGVGKSTLAKRLAAEFNIAYLDTGAMYRTLALKFGAAAADISSEKLKEKCKSITFSLRQKDRSYALFCNDIEIGEEIRTEKAGRLASLFAKLPEVREALHEAQRQIALSCPLVAEGRDMGTNVFPQAPIKIFLDASPEVRAERRYKELKEKNTLQGETLESIFNAISQRDKQDRERTIDPLRPAPDAVMVDTSSKNLEEVFEELCAIVREHSVVANREKQGQLYTVKASVIKDNSCLLNISEENPVNKDKKNSLVQEFLSIVEETAESEGRLTCSLEINPVSLASSLDVSHAE